MAQSEQATREQQYGNGLRLYEAEPPRWDREKGMQIDALEQLQRIKRSGPLRALPEPVDPANRVRPSDPTRAGTVPKEVD